MIQQEEPSEIGQAGLACVLQDEEQIFQFRMATITQITQLKTLHLLCWL